MAGAVSSRLRPRVRVVSELACRDTQTFARACGVHSSTISDDPSEVLFDLERELDRGTTDLVYGLTRDSTRFLFEQSAARHAYAPLYSGEHRYSGQQLRHKLNGSASGVNALARGLQANPLAWPQSLADAIAALATRADTPAHIEFFTVGECPHDGAGYLTSWLLGRS